MVDEALSGDKKEYELSFLLIDEAAIGEIESSLLNLGAELKRKAAVALTKLAYPIKKHESAYFGFCVFVGLPDKIKFLDEVLRANAKVLRFLIITPAIKPPVREPRGERGTESVGGERREWSPRPSRPVIESKPAEPQILSNEGLEKKLEEILK